MGARAAAAALGLVLGACASGASEGAPSDRAIVQVEARRAVLTARDARVIVSTDSMATAREACRTLATPRTFERVPACAGRVTAAQLALLERMRGVRSIAIDRGGEGHLAQALPLAGFTPVETSGLDGSGITVAIIDSGIDRNHPDLAGAVVDEACFCGSDCCPGGVSQAFGEGSAADDSGHGTHVAGIVASRGTAIGPRGGAPAVELIAIKVLTASNGFCCTSDAIAALDWLLAEHPEVDVVNMSFGANGLYAGDCDGDTFAEPVAIAAQALIDHGVLLVASSGNNGDATALPSPACVRDVVSVGAVWDEDVGAEAILCQEPMTSPDRIACFSNASTTLDLLAPGALIESTWPDSMVRGRAGTSQAAPMVSACAALLRQAQPSASVPQVISALRTSPTLLADARNGLSFPRLDCSAALSALDTLLSDGGTDAGEDAGADAGGDAGSSIDGGSDAGPSGDAGPIDASAPDAGQPVDGGATEPDGSAEPTSDAGLDATAMEPVEDSGASGASGADGGLVLTAGGGGCSCDVAGAPSVTSPGRAGLLGLALALGLRHSARRRRAA